MPPYNQRDPAGDHHIDNFDSTQTLHASGSGDIPVISLKSDVPEYGEEMTMLSEPVGFWALPLRTKSLKIISRCSWTTLAISAYMFGVVALFTAILLDVENHLSSLIVQVVDFEANNEALIGPLVQQIAQGHAIHNESTDLGYVNVPAARYDSDPANVRRAIYEQKAWAAILVHENATFSLRQAAEQGDLSYNPLSACEIIFVEARDQNTYRNYILPRLAKFQTEVLSAFAKEWIPQVMSNTSLSSKVVNAPLVLSPAIGFSEVNLRPFGPAIAQSYVTYGLVFLVIASFFCVRFYRPINMEFLNTKDEHPPLKFYQLIIWRWLASVGSYFIISLAYSLVGLALHKSFFGPITRSIDLVPEFSNKYGIATFPTYWLINFLGLTALGLACENVTMVVELPWAQLWLIFWVITDSSTASFPLELAPAFYEWGYATPLYNMMSAIRTILFDLHSNLGVNFGAMLGWIGVDTLLYPVCCIYLRWKTNRDKKRQQ